MRVLVLAVALGALLLTGCGAHAQGDALAELADSLRGQPGVSEVRTGSIGAGGIGLNSGFVEITSPDAVTAADVVARNRDDLAAFRDGQIKDFMVAVRVHVATGTSVLRVERATPDPAALTLLEAPLPAGALARFIGLAPYGASTTADRVDTVPVAERVVSYVTGESADTGAVVSVAESAKALDGYRVQVLRGDTVLLKGADEADLRARAAALRRLLGTGSSFTLDAGEVVVPDPALVEEAAIILGESPSWTVRNEHRYSVVTGPGQSPYVGLITALSRHPAVTAVSLDESRLTVRFAAGEDIACREFQDDPPQVPDHELRVDCGS